jgi:hypothetical protein
MNPSYPEAQKTSIDSPKEMPLSMVEVMVKEGQELEGVMAVLPLMRVKGHSPKHDHLSFSVFKVLKALKKMELAVP